MKLAVALSQRAASLGRRGADRDVSGRGIGAPGRGHHGGIVGHARVSPSTVSDLNKKILRDDRGVAQSSDRGATWPPFARPRSSSLRNAERSVSPLIALPVRGLITSWQMSSCGKPKAATRSTVSRSLAVGSKAGMPFLLTRFLGSAPARPALCERRSPGSPRAGCHKPRIRSCKAERSDATRIGIVPRAPLGQATSTLGTSPIRHALLEVPDHRRLDPGDRDRQRSPPIGHSVRPDHYRNARLVPLRGESLTLGSFFELNLSKK